MATVGVAVWSDPVRSGAYHHIVDLVALSRSALVKITDL